MESLQPWNIEVIHNPQASTPESDTSVEEYQRLYLSVLDNMLRYLPEIVAMAPVFQQLPRISCSH
ncbi:hypothetical protein PAMP_020487 [Pampus punctatissimus]